MPRALRGQPEDDPPPFPGILGTDQLPPTNPPITDDGRGGAGHAQVVRHVEAAGAATPAEEGQIQRSLQHALDAILLAAQGATEEHWRSMAPLHICWMASLNLCGLVSQANSGRMQITTFVIRRTAACVLFITPDVPPRTATPPAVAAPITNPYLDTRNPCPGREFFGVLIMPPSLQSPLGRLRPALPSMPSRHACSFLLHDSFCIRLEWDASPRSSPPGSNSPQEPTPRAGRRR